MEKQKLVVIGNGMAGARFVEETLARGRADRFDITMFGDEPCRNYNRILLSNVLAGSHDPDDILINPLPWYERNGVNLHAGVRAGWIDRISKAVYAAGISESYDQRVIGTGSTPYIPPLGDLYDDDGELKEGVFAFCTLEDCRKLTNYAGTARKETVIGGGLVELEAARGLLARGLEVHVVHINPYLMDTQLDRESGRMLKSTMEDLGVNIHLERWIVNVLGGPTGERTGFSGGDPLDCDMEVVAAGVRPNVDLAKQAGLQVQHGIIVKDDLSCRNNADVYAIGERAQHRGQLYGVVAPLWDQAEILAQGLTEENPDATFRGVKVSTKLKVMWVELAVMGDNEPLSQEDELVHYSEPSRGVYKKLIIREGRLAGAILLGAGMATPGVLQSIDRGQLLPRNRAELLFSTSAAAKVMDLSDLSATAQICACNRVSNGRIAEAVQNGQDTFKAVCEATRPGSGCGTRKGQVQAVLDDALSALVADSSPAPALTLLELALPGQD